MSREIKSLIVLGLLLFLGAAKLHAQDEKNWSLNGYVKYMQTDFIGKDSAGLTLLTDNLIHNRLNFNWYASDKLSLKVDCLLYTSIQNSMEFDVPDLDESFFTPQNMKKLRI